jgi:nitrate reductase gamma subunit
MRSELLFVGFPYAAAAILAVGLVARLVLARGRTAETSRRARENWALFGSGRAWRAALVVLVGAHLFGLLLPRLVLSWNSEPYRQYVIEGAGFAAGIVALAGWAGIMWRHLARRHGSIAADVVDCAWLSLAFVAIASGIVVAVGYRWASSWAGGTLSPYFESLFQGAPATPLVEQMPFLVQLHVVTLFALVAVFPFTGAALVLVVALNRASTVAVVGGTRAAGVVAWPLRAVADAMRAQPSPPDIDWSEEPFEEVSDASQVELGMVNPVDPMGGVAGSQESSAPRH